MDISDPRSSEEHSDGEEKVTRRPQLPDDLPKTLDDRKSPPPIDSGFEYYDAWQGQSKFLTNPTPAKPLDFKLGLDDDDTYDVVYSRQNSAGDSRFNEMLAAQASYQDDGAQGKDENQIVTDKKLSEAQKKSMLQKALNTAASNGDKEKVQRLVSGEAKKYVDVNAPDDEGTPPLIYASCFGHEDVVATLLKAEAKVDQQDRHQWSSLMWATTNRHKSIIKLLLDNGASPDARSSSGRTAFDFVGADNDLSEYLHENGYSIGNAGVANDFYSSGFEQDRFEEEMAETEMKRRMMMESAMNLEVDLGNLGLDEQPESPEDLDDGHEFMWDKCLNDQMFVFQESDLGRILDIIITNMTPQRSPSQKPVPANILFLSARYAYYHANPDLLETLLVTAMDKINDVVERHQLDMTILAFWISNATLLLHYLKKDGGLSEATPDFQMQLTDLINEIFILLIRDAERRMDKVLDTAMLDHETIPGFEDVHFQNEWKLFRSKTKKEAESPEKRFKPPSPKRRAKPSPRNIISLLSSTLFVLDLYDIHSVITSQILAQLLYWLGAELFNRIMSNRKYLARTKAMQVRMNVSALEEWARAHNRQPGHYENGSMVASGENTADAARRHLAPVVQLLQWLQIFSSLGENLDSLKSTVQDLPRLSSQRLLHAVKYYRAEVGEKGLPKSAMRYLRTLQKEEEAQRVKRKSGVANIAARVASGAPANGDKNMTSDQAEQELNDDDTPENLLLDPALMLPFCLPSSTDMLVSYGAGFGGRNRERERKYIPTVPPEFLAKLDPGGIRTNSVYDEYFTDED